MSGRGGAAYAPGGRQYEKKKSGKKRRGGRSQAWYGPADGESANVPEDSSEGGSEEEEECEGGAGGSGLVKRGQVGEMPSSESEEEFSEEETTKAKGVQGLIEVENPNIKTQKQLKPSELDENTTVELSRREREEIEKQRAKEQYWKLHKEGKTDEARKDLERLQLIREQREAAAKKREEEKKAKEEAAKAKEASRKKK